jgi:hypothetical protein
MTFDLWSAFGGLLRFAQPSPTTGCMIVPSMRPVHLPLPRGTGIHVLRSDITHGDPQAHIFWKVSRGMEGLLHCLTGGMRA